MDVFRMLSGVMVEGYRMRFRKTPAKEGEYKVPLSFFGKQITETTNIVLSPCISNFFTSFRFQH